MFQREAQTTSERLDPGPERTLGKRRELVEQRLDESRVDDLERELEYEAGVWVRPISLVGVGGVLAMPGRAKPTVKTHKNPINQLTKPFPAHPAIPRNPARTGKPTTAPTSHPLSWSVTQSLTVDLLNP
jgi:hypothetical protein